MAKNSLNWNKIEIKGIIWIKQWNTFDRRLEILKKENPKHQCRNTRATPNSQHQVKEL